MIKKLSLYAFALLGCLVLFNSCKKEYEDIETVDERSIAEYIAKNNLTNVEKDALGYYYQILTPGTGAAVTNADSVYYTYDFKNTSGTSFLKTPEYQLSSTFLGYTDRFSFKTIPAVRNTLGMLKKGGTARVILPSRMAFGKNGVSSLGIGSNEVIVIDLALLDLNNRVEADNYVINKFITANSLQMTLDPSRVRYSISAVGTGKETVLETSTIKAKYTGRLLDGTVFDSSTDGADFRLDEVVAGWTKIIPGKIGVGGKIRLLIPSDLGYGKSSQSDGNGQVIIPGNSCLDFDIEIISVTN